MTDQRAKASFDPAATIPADSPILGGLYLFHEVLGKGGMGMVHRATDGLTGEQVALKQITVRADELHITSKSKTQTTIIALTANVMATDIAKLKEAGFSGLIGKPVNNRLFPDLLKSILAGESVWHIS